MHELYKKAVGRLTEAVRLAPTVKDWQDSLKKAQQALASPAQTKVAPTPQTPSGKREFVKG